VLATEVGGRVPDDPGLLDEVTDLVNSQRRCAATSLPSTCVSERSAHHSNEEAPALLPVVNTRVA